MQTDQAPGNAGKQLPAPNNKDQDKARILSFFLNFPSLPAFYNR